MSDVQDEQFASCTSIGDTSLRISETVADVLFAHLAAAYPQLKALQAGSSLVACVERALRLCAVDNGEWLKWGTALAAQRDTSATTIDTAPLPKHI